jgi:hypothetical protein
VESYACAVTDEERVDAILAEFASHGAELGLESSRRGHWFAKYRRNDAEGWAGTGVAHGNTRLEAAEMALGEFRRMRVLASDSGAAHRSDLRGTNLR